MTTPLLLRRLPLILLVLATLTMPAAHAQQTGCEPAEARRCADIVASWSNPDNRPANGRDRLLSLLPVDDSLAVATGWTTAPDGSVQWVVVGFDLEDGSVRWEQRYASGGYDVPTDAVLTADGETLLVAGVSGFDGMALDYPFAGTATVVAFDTSAGTRTWVHRLDLETPAVARAIAISSGDDPTLFVASTVRAPNPNGYETDMTTTAFRLSDRRLLWQQHHDDPAHAGNADSVQQHDVARTILLDGSGDTVYVAGDSYGPLTSMMDMIGVAYDAHTGERRWTARHAGPHGYDDALQAAALSPDGRTLVLSGYEQGYTDTMGTNFEFGTAAFDTANGQQRWSRGYAGEARPLTVGADTLSGTGQNVPFDVVVTDDRVFVAGAGTSSRGRNDVDFTVVSYRLDDGSDALAPIQHDGGNRLWDVATAMALSPGGDELYVTGYSQTVPGTVHGQSTSVGWLGPVAVQPHAHARTLAIDSSSGAIRWTGEVNSTDVGAGSAYPGIDTVVPHGATLSADGQSLLVGATFYRGSDTQWLDEGWNFSDIGAFTYTVGAGSHHGHRS